MLSPESVDSIIGLMTANWDLASQFFVDIDNRSTAPEYGVAAANALRNSITPSTAARWLRGGYDTTDVTSCLADIRAPTLLIHTVDDATIPFSGAQEMAARIPQARLVAFPGSGHLYLGDDVSSLTQVIGEFLDEGSPARFPNTATLDRVNRFRTVLFTDLVGHTAMMQRLGDDTGRAVLREHEQLLREALKRFGGAEVKSMGDGFMASFASVTSAMDCAIAIQRAFAERNRRSRADGGPQLHIRVGLNVGEPIEEDGDLFGSVVILASRITAEAGANEILVPESVRHLLAGKDYTYAPRGETSLKGFAEPMRLYAVQWDRAAGG